MKLIALLISAFFVVVTAQASQPSCQDKYQARMSQCFASGGSISSACGKKCLDDEHVCMGGR